MTLNYNDMTLDELRPALIRAMLPHVSFDGWTSKALAAAAQDLNLTADHASLAFPNGAAQMVAVFIAQADADLEAALAQRGLHNTRIRDRITTAVRTRLELAAPDKEAIRRALAVHSLPMNAVTAAKSLAGTIDAMWRAAGDTSTDFNFYTKRATLAAVYSATLLVWLNDESPDHAETWAFLDRRIDNVMGIEKLKGRWRKQTANMPNLTRFLGRLRYGARA
jgi:ubiquinone biosynthesis protein COQ9